MWAPYVVPVGFWARYTPPQGGPSMDSPNGPRRRGRYKVLLLVYAVILILFVIALWVLVPAEVKKVIYETYINPP